MKHELYIIVAADENDGIGKDGTIPWHFKKEMQFFAKTTKAVTDTNKKNMVIMGRTTWESLPEKYRPLPDRQNVVLTKNHEFKAEGAEIAHTLADAIALADDRTEKIFIIGGAKVFDEAFHHPNLKGIYLTRVHQSFDCDTFLPALPGKFSQQKKINSEEEENVSFDYMYISA